LDGYKPADELLYYWLNAVMADKVMFTAMIDNAFAGKIGLEDNTMDNTVRIIRTASRKLIGRELSSGRISNILVERQGSFWKIVVFKEKFPAK